MIQFGNLPTAGLGIVAGGLLLGAGLAGFANPSPKEPAAPAWGNRLEPRIATAEAPIYYQSYPEDLNPGPSLVDGYVPAVASTRMQAPLEAATGSTDSQWDRRWAEARSTRERDDSMPAEDTIADRAVPHYAAFERTEASRQGRAESSAEADKPANGDDDAASLRTPVDLANPPPLPAVRPRIIHIASADSDE